MVKGRIAILDKPLGKFKIEEVPVPEPKKGEMLARQVMCGVCGTDVHMYQGHLPGIIYPIVLGHEIVGAVQKLGEGVETDSTGRPVKEGDLVFSSSWRSCGKCYFCSVLKRPNLCLKGTFFGFNPFPKDRANFYGGYAEYVYFKHPRYTFLKVEAKPETAVFLDPMVIGLHIAERVHQNVSDTVVIQGAGAIGLASLIASKLKGAYKSIVIGAPETRLKLAEECGADVTINIEEVKDPRKRVKMVKAETIGEHGADVVIECTGVPAAIPEGLKMLRQGGTYAVAGHFTDAGSVQLNPFADFNNKDITLVGVWGADFSHSVRGRVIIESKRYPVEKLVTHKLPLERCEEAMKAIMGDYRLDGREVGKIAVVGSL